MAASERHHPGMGQIFANVALAGGVILGTTFIANELRKSTLPALSVEGGQDPGVLPTSRVNKTATRTPEPTLIPHTPTSIPATVEEAGGYNFTKTPEASATLETPTMSPEEKAVLDLGYTINDGMAFGKDGKKIIFRERELSDKAVFEIAAKDYQATNIGKENFNNPQPSREFQDYTLAIIDEAGQTLRKRNQLSRSWYPVLIPNSNNGWIVFYEENDVILNAIYRKSNGTLVIYAVFEDVSN